MARPQYSLRLVHRRPKYPNLIRGARLEAGLTQRELAQRIGMERSTISDWECGQRLPRFLNALKLAKALNTLVEELFYELDRPHLSKRLVRSHRGVRTH